MPTLPKGVFHLSSATMKQLQQDVRETFPDANLMGLLVQPVKGVWVEELDLREADPVLRGFVHGFIAGMNRYRQR